MRKIRLTEGGNAIDSRKITNQKATHEMKTPKAGNGEKTTKGSP